MRSQVIGCVAPMRAGARGWGWYHRALAKMNAPKAAAKGYDFAVPSPEQARPRAFFNVQIGNTEPEKVVVEIASDIVPKTAANFMSLCAGENGIGYKNTPFHTIQKNQYVTGGDIVAGNGTGNQSSFGGYFADENFALRFTEAGVLGMANAGVNTNGSQFFITLQAMPHLDGRNVAFGKVVEGLDVVRKVESVYCVKGKPLTEVKVVDCGLL
ncbi:peptidyl-prolyl cis-trans isomerase [Thraustotheca clavata]|uniref:Peptidyl-prolyl cis-trans isomerase n=1 Tax=Thraustotheca clavata TaxID=74557 RepID=A0A1W0A7N9_9STRA|nr:peptidyl-prolyl cis-trans isomerase [Thraustotheca clavata]